MTFDIEMYKPLANLALGLRTLHYQLSNVTTAAPFGTTNILSNNSGTFAHTTIGAGNTNSTIYFPKTTIGTFMIILYTVGSTPEAVYAYPFSVGTGNATITSQWAGYTGPNLSQTAISPAGVTTTSQNCTQCCIVNIGAFNGADTTVTLPVNTETLPEGTTYGDLWITEINPSITT